MTRPDQCPVCGKAYQWITERVATCGCETILAWEHRGFNDLKPLTNAILTEFATAVWALEDAKPETVDLAGKYQREAAIHRILDEMEAMMFEGIPTMDLFGEREDGTHAYAPVIGATGEGAPDRGHLEDQEGHGGGAGVH